MVWGILVRNLHFIVMLVNEGKWVLLSASPKGNRTAPAHSSFSSWQGGCKEATGLAHGPACVSNHPNQQSKAKEPNVGPWGWRQLPPALGAWISYAMGSPHCHRAEILKNILGVWNITSSPPPKKKPKLKKRMSKQYKYSCPSLPHSQCVPFTWLAARLLQAASPGCAPAGICAMLEVWVGQAQDLGSPWSHITGQPEAVAVAKREVEACVKDEGSPHLGRLFWPMLCWLQGVHPNRAMARSSRGCGHCADTP